MTPSHIIQEKAARKKYWIMAVTALQPIYHKLSNTMLLMLIYREIWTPYYWQLVLLQEQTPDIQPAVMLPGLGGQNCELL